MKHTNMIWAGTILAFIIGAHYVEGGWQTTTPTFEVTSIKRNTSLPDASSTSYLPGGRFSARFTTLGRLIINAYHIKDYQLTGGPDWIYSEHYDVDAKSESGTNPTRSDVRLMVQRLLTDGFHLTMHHETKQLAVYTLTVAKTNEALQPAPDRPSNGFDVGKGEITGHGVSMVELADELTRLVDRPVIDKTGMTGVFDLTLKFSLLDSTVGSTADSAQPDIFSAIQEQLGLKMQATRSDVDVLVVDGAERPKA